MTFVQEKLDRSVNQARGIFNKYVYQTSDTIADVQVAGYFSASRFATLDGPATNSDGWHDGIIECQCSDGYLVGIMDSSTGTMTRIDTVQPDGFGGQPIAVSTVFIGDSLTGNGFLTNGVAATDSYGPYYTGGTFARTDDYGFTTWLDFLTNGSLGNVINSGIGGNTTSDILRRVVSDVLAYKPVQVIDESGSNDVVAGETADAIIARKQQLFDLYHSIGAKIIAVDISPRFSFTTGMRDVAVAVNRWLRQQAATVPYISTFPLSAILADYASFTGGVSAARTFDDTHPNNLGAFLGGKSLADFSRPVHFQPIKYSIWPGDASGSSLSDAFIRNINPGMALGTGGVLNTGVTGQVAQGYTCSRLSGTPTVVASLVERADGLGFNQRLVITFGAANDAVEFGIPAGTLTSRYLPGRKMGVSAKLEFAASSADVVDRCMIYATADVAAVTYQATAHDKFWLTRRANLPLSSGLVVGTMRSPRYQMPAGTGTSFATQMRVYASAAGVVTLDISQYTVTLHP